MVKFDQVIKPGKRGIITLSVKVYEEWGAKRFTKQAMVVSNDPSQENVVLSLTGQVAGPAYNPASVTPPETNRSQ